MFASLTATDPEAVFEISLISTVTVDIVHKQVHVRSKVMLSSYKTILTFMKTGI